MINLSNRVFLMHVILSVISVVLLTACDPSAQDKGDLSIDPVALDASVCTLEPELCEETCAKCPDKEACFKQNGFCVAFGLEFNDTGDANIDIFTPGCHQKYPAGQCPNNPAFFLGDVCGRNQPNNLIEWTDSACHGPSGDRSTFDCNVECLRRGLGNGSCMAVANACGVGKNSAVCKCDIAPPTP